jgi:hypothetical protein
VLCASLHPEKRQWCNEEITWVRRKEEAMKKIKYKYVAPWTVIASMLFLAVA